MKTNFLTRLIPALAAGLLLTVPATGLAKHKHRDHCRSSRSSVYIGTGFGYGYGGGYYSPFHTGYSYPHYSSYCEPRYSYYPRTSFGLSFTSYPRYYSSSRYYRPSYGSSSRYSPRASYYTDELAVDVQRALRRSGYYYGAIDGDIGPASRAAIRDYQRDRGLPVTGRIDSSLLRSLRIG